MTTRDVYVFILGAAAMAIAVIVSELGAIGVTP